MVVKSLLIKYANSGLLYLQYSLSNPSHKNTEIVTQTSPSWLN